MSDDSGRFASAPELSAQLAKVFGLDISGLLSFTLDMRAGKLPTLTTERLVRRMYAGDFEAISQRFELVPVRDASTTSANSATDALSGAVEVPYTDANGAIWRPGWPATEADLPGSADPSDPSACASDARRSSAPDPQQPAVAPGSAATPDDPQACPENGTPTGAGEP